MSQDQLYCTQSLQTSLSRLTYRVVPLAWETEFKDQELLDEILFKLIYIKDGLSDEAIFRERVAGIAYKSTDVVTP